nr:hypothetical protein L204_00916 [Cryptococcus depauperatus CBS 7855]
MPVYGNSHSSVESFYTGDMLKPGMSLVDKVFKFTKATNPPLAIRTQKKNKTVTSRVKSENDSLSDPRAMKVCKALRRSAQKVALMGSVFLYATCALLRWQEGYLYWHVEPHPRTSSSPGKPQPTESLLSLPVIMTQLPW